MEKNENIALSEETAAPCGADTKRSFGDIVKHYADRYFIKALGAMAKGLFASLLIGTIIAQFARIPALSGILDPIVKVAQNGFVVGGALGNVLDDVAEQFDRVHVDAGLRGTHVHRRADDVGLAQRGRQRADEQLLGQRHRIGDERRVAADQIDAHRVRRAVKCVGDLHEVGGGLAAAGADERDRRDRDALVHNRNAEVAFD